MRFLKNFISVIGIILFSSILVLATVPSSQAQSPTPGSSGSDIEEFSLEPPQLIRGADGKFEDGITDLTKSVRVTFGGLTNTDDDNDYVLCVGEEDCFKGGLKSTLEIIENDDVLSVSDGATRFTACGDGNKKIKIKKASEECGGDDYFHGGNTYLFSIGKLKDDSFYKPLKLGGFYVAKAFPTLDPKPVVGKREIRLSLKQDFILKGGNNRNNYQIVVKGGEDEKEEDCDYVFKNAGQTITKTYGNLTVGEYIIDINEQKNEGGLRTDNCQGGFTYYRIFCNLDNNGGTCSEEIQEDPNGSELKKIAELIGDMGNQKDSVIWPCGDGTGNPITNPNDCKTLNTALGPIELGVQGFIKVIFGAVLTLASFGGVLVIIYAGYVFMTSRGDKEKIQSARETITAAIVGLLFIVLSIVILEVIGVDILAIPGFER